MFSFPDVFSLLLEAAQIILIQEASKQPGFTTLFSFADFSPHSPHKLQQNWIIVFT